MSGLPLAAAAQGHSVPAALRDAAIPIPATGRQERASQRTAPSGPPAKERRALPSAGSAAQQPWTKNRDKGRAELEAVGRILFTWAIMNKWEHTKD